MSDGDPEELTLLDIFGQEGIRAVHPHEDVLANEALPLIHEESARKELGFTKDLKPVADPQDQATLRGMLHHLLHDGGKAGNSTSAQIIPVGKAAGEDDQFGPLEVPVLMPEGTDLSSKDFGEGISDVLIAVGSGKGDDATLHAASKVRTHVIIQEHDEEPEVKNKGGDGAIAFSCEEGGEKKAKGKGQKGPGIRVPEIKGGEKGDGQGKEEE